MYKNTFSLSVLAVDGLLSGFGLWLGYLAGVVAIKHFGYGNCLKAAFCIWAVVSFATAVVAGQIMDWFMILAVLKALPAGMYAATIDTIMLRETTHGWRHNFLQIKLAFEFFAGIMLPTLIGALISYAKGYELAFVLAGFVYLIALSIPLRLPRPEMNLSVKGVIETFRRPLYPQHATNRTAAAGFNQLNAFAVMIIPFLILQDEMKVGLVTSLIALTAGIISLAIRKTASHQRVKLGYTAYTIRGLASLIFVTFWTAPLMIFWQMVNKLSTPLHDPLHQGLDIQNDSLILGENLQERALNLNILNNTLILLGTTVAYGVFLLASQMSGQPQLVLQSLVLTYAGWRLFNLTATIWINKKAQLNLVNVSE